MPRRPVRCSSTGCTRRRTSTWRTTTSTAGRWPSDHKWQRYWTLDRATARIHRRGVQADRRRRVRSPRATCRERVGKKGTWWDWDDAKIALEHLFWNGRDHGDAPAQRLRPDLRPHRAGDPRRGAGPPGRARARRPQATARTRRAPPRDRHVHRSHRLPPPEATSRASRWSPSWSRRARCREVQVEGWAQPAVPAPRGPHARDGSTPARC